MDHAKKQENKLRERDSRKNMLVGGKRRRSDGSKLTFSSHRHPSQQVPKTFKCHLESCGKIFNDRASLKKHMTVHGDKLYPCMHPGCEKRFLDNAKLKRHMLVHTGEKPYQCKVCGKRFSLDFNLKTHQRIHTGEKPFPCEFPNCDKRFNQKSNLHAHMQTHHLDELKSNDYLLRNFSNMTQDEMVSSLNNLQNQLNKASEAAGDSNDRRLSNKEKEEARITKIISENDGKLF